MASEYTFRCNTHTCRTELTDRAVVTTCSHIFCIPCAENLGLTAPDFAHRLCPACKTRLVNEDDCAINNLNPTEDYKTSILSGMSPTVIMECAARALAFYSYQAYQEINYQVYLSTKMSEKSQRRSNELETYVLQAKGEIQQLREVVESKQKSIVSLENKHYDLGEAFREKSKALQETQAKYQSLKGQLMTAEQQSAASDEAEHALHANLGINPESHIIQGYPLGLSARSHQPRPLQTRLPRPIHEMRTQGSHVESQAQNLRFGNTPSIQRIRLPIGRVGQSGTTHRHSHMDNEYSVNRTNSAPDIERDYATGRTHRRNVSVFGHGISNRAKLGGQGSNRMATMNGSLPFTNDFASL